MESVKVYKVRTPAHGYLGKIIECGFFRLVTKAEAAFFSREGIARPDISKMVPCKLKDLIWEEVNGLP